MSSRGDAQVPFRRDLVATAALTSYTFVVAFGFVRVFSGWEFLIDLGVVAVVGHGVSFLLRRARVNGWLAIPFTTLLLLWVLIAQQYADTMNWLIPTASTWDQIDLEVSLVRDQFQTAVAPVLYGAGWATLAGFALILAIVMSDSFAFRADARGEALVPGGVLFVFIAALSSPRLRIVSTVLLLASGVIVVIALRWMHDRRRRVKLSAGRRPAALVVPTAFATAIAIAVLAGFVGPRLPGAQAEPLYKTRGRGGGVTSVISPLVDIRSRLTNQSDVELFRVNATAPSYWRATTLPVFDGQTFQLPTRALERVDGDFGAGLGIQIRQQIQVLVLGGKLVPAAADPFQAEGFSAGRPIDLRLNRDTSTLVAPDEITSGDLFTVVSSSPQLTPEVLRSATASSPPDSIFLDLPDDLPDVVADLATEVTDGAASEYDAAVALQNWFRTEFRYSLDVQRGHGSKAIESFLTERVGYCEQFAATFAAMARTLDIPSRVAVGFTPGVLDDEGWYRVLGRNAHAWPEIWFDDIGWVAFEPTPGRGEPGAEVYTNVRPQQDETPQGTPGGAVDPNAVPTPTAPATAVPPGTNVPSQNPNNAPQFDSLSPPTGTSPTSNGSNAPLLLLIITIVLALVSALPWLVTRIRARSYRASNGAERVQMAWARARSAAEQAGVTALPSMTAKEWARTTAAQLPIAARPMRSLADMVDLATYAPPGSIDLDQKGAVGSTVGHDCELWSDQVTRIAVNMLTPWQRVRRYFTTWR